MYRLSPYTYLVEGLIGQALGGQIIECAKKELATLQPPSGETCGAYLEAFISRRGGYLVNPDATSDCSFCSSRTTDQYFGPIFNIFYPHHWRNAGLLCAYIVFNTAAVYALTYTFRVRSGNPISFVKKRLASRKLIKS
jgi:ATP-binding cassette subfamily G (WHITE) protein 2 (SNQ2)